MRTEDIRRRTDFPTITDAAELVEHEKDTPPDIVEGTAARGRQVGLRWELESLQNVGH